MAGAILKNNIYSKIVKFHDCYMDIKSEHRIESNTFNTPLHTMWIYFKWIVISDLYKDVNFT